MCFADCFSDIFPDNTVLAHKETLRGERDVKDPSLTIAGYRRRECAD